MIEELPTGSKGTIAQMCLDLSDLSSVSRIVQLIKSKYPNRKVDKLIQNAALWPSKYELSKQGYEMAFATNVLGPHLLFHMLLKVNLLSPNARIIMVTGDIYITIDDR